MKTELLKQTGLAVAYTQESSFVAGDVLVLIPSQLGKYLKGKLPNQQLVS